MIDSPNMFAPLETLERHLANVQALPNDAQQRARLIQQAHDNLKRARKLREETASRQKVS
jgi:hypothetical protein